MVVPPSRSSQESRLSTLSSSLSSPLSSSLSSPRPLSSALSLGSEDLAVSEPNFDLQLYLDRLLPCVNGLLSRFDRVNQLTEDVHGLEVKLEEVQRRRRRKRDETGREGEERGEGRGGTASGGERPIAERVGRRTALLPHKPRISLPSSPPSFNPNLLPSFSTSSASPSLPHICSSYFESAILQPQPRLSRDTHSSEAAESAQGSSGLGLEVGPMWPPGAGWFPRRRAWHSGSSHSADAAQRPTQAHDGGGGGGGGGASSVARPRSEEGDRRRISEGVPVKRKAWTSDGPETEKD